MRTHAQIIHDAGGPLKVREILAKRGFDLADPTVRSWERRPDSGGSIPSSYWGALSKARVTSLTELAAYAEARAVKAAGKGAGA